MEAWARKLYEINSCFVLPPRRTESSLLLGSEASRHATHGGGTPGLCVAVSNFQIDSTSRIHDAMCKRKWRKLPVEPQQELQFSSCIKLKQNFRTCDYAHETGITRCTYLRASVPLDRVLYVFHWRGAEAHGPHARRYCCIKRFSGTYKLASHLSTEALPCRVRELHMLALGEITCAAFAWLLLGCHARCARHCFTTGRSIGTAPHGTTKHCTPDHAWATLAVRIATN